jgi:hypothetical protein
MSFSLSFKLTVNEIESFVAFSSEIGKIYNYSNKYYYYGESIL